MKKFLKISELSTLLNLIDKKKNKPSNHILRYWEKDFKQIKPQVINKQRYYDTHQVEIIKLIKFLIKDKGMTINGVKTVLNSDKINKLDGYNSNGLKAEYYKKLLKEKSITLLKKINNLKKYGKKNTSKS